MAIVSEQRYLTLPSGLSLPLEPVLLCLDLEARGLTLSRHGDHILVRPAGRLTDADRTALRRWRDDVLVLIDHTQEVQ